MSLNTLCMASPNHIDSHNWICIQGKFRQYIMTYLQETLWLIFSQHYDSHPNNIMNHALKTLWITYSTIMTQILTTLWLTPWQHYDLRNSSISNHKIICVYHPYNQKLHTVLKYIRLYTQWPNVIICTIYIVNLYTKIIFLQPVWLSRTRAPIVTLYKWLISY
jgi:hypothetical protein